MQALIDETQQEFRELADDIAASIGITNPSDIDGADPLAGWRTLQSAGVLELRERTDGAPLAGGVEVALLSQALGAALSPAPYLAGGALAVDLISRSGDVNGWLPGLLAGTDHYSLLLTPALDALGGTAGEPGVLWGASRDAGFAVTVLRGDDGVIRVARRPIAGARRLDSISLTNELWEPPVEAEWEPGGTLSQDDLDRFTALALTGLAADTAGALRAALTGVVEYSKQRVAYGVHIGSFQAVQHIAAEAHVAIEAIAAAVNYAAWAVDELDADAALLAARTAKAVAARNGRPTAEAVMQLYGGIGQTWEHIAHFYTRRAIFDTVLFGGEDAQLRAIADARLGGE
ncbi:acyl-CoA dehydrogenase family protein [Microbacterium sp. zg-Y818]|uniref:acyl-CoA dehydrogenase family protein n=1 Tax=unclassified Microbacterium TaxID=2609290 RepID=UPI00214AC9B4|nr:MULTISPECIES: acyl-CoA dehydrogenase family protein [unclassified Microbacterium]MCR2799333.1 acyl-CoA dehydrogenase family protein [Microbacterium sp. zg.Y818]WIM21334.1 acyl-CoA dehydrogenase family protein [Microbacterium sp. zg-Y818]